ncbi:MAG: hypothetical protein PHU71_05225 [Candidatus Gracilibacteria bacterium]|nr:hypothetical protein [Candidatus Gracilibacteria bacterium]
MSILIVYLIFAAVLIVFTLLAWYSVHRVFSVPHPYHEARFVTGVFVLLSTVVVVWAVYLLLEIEWALLL